MPMPTTSYRSRVEDAHHAGGGQARDLRARCWCRRRPPRPAYASEPRKARSPVRQSRSPTLAPGFRLGAHARDWAREPTRTDRPSRPIRRRRWRSPSVGRAGNRARRSTRAVHFRRPTSAARTSTRRWATAGTATRPGTALEDAIGALEGGRGPDLRHRHGGRHAVLELVPPGAVVVLPPAATSACPRPSTPERPLRLDGPPGRRDRHRAILAAADGADLVWLESPTNPMIEVADLPRIGAGWPDGCRLVVDNTFATPLLQRPLDVGADLVVHSVTKMLSGHSDVLLGAVVVRPTTTATGSAAGRGSAGCTARSRARWRPTWSLRGLRTLPVRLATGPSPTPRCWPSGWRGTRRCGGSAIPGCRTTRATSGPAGRCPASARSSRSSWPTPRRPTPLVAALPALGVRHQPGWGRVHPGAPAALADGELASVPEGLVRLSVGIEHVEDLWADLDQALDGLRVSTGPTGSGSLASRLNSAPAWPTETSAR